jgi:glycosyltransferase involved in cell wall biosynthesis
MGQTPVPVPGRVSVMIPAYNQESFIEETIASVRAQAYPDLEIVVADDGSTDRTAEVIRRVAADDRRIVPIFAEQNGGQSVNTNRGLDRCTGEYVALLGGDDIMLPGKITLQVDFMRAHPDCGICTHDMDVFDSRTGASLYRLYERFAPKNGGVASLFTTNWLFGREVKAIPSSSMYRAACIGARRYDVRLRIVNEWLFEIDCLMESRLTWRTMPGTLGRYRVHDRQMSRSAEATDRGFEEALMVLAIAAVRYPEIARLIRDKREHVVFRHLIFGWLARAKQSAYDRQFRIEAGTARWLYMRAARLAVHSTWLVDAVRPARRFVHRLVDRA